MKTTTIEYRDASTDRGQPLIIEHEPGTEVQLLDARVGELTYFSYALIRRDEARPR